MAYNPYTGRWEMDDAQQVQMQSMPRPQTQPPRLGILTVSSEASIDKLRMQPNDSALALNENENLLYLIRTDSLTAKTINRFRIFPEPTEEEKAANQLQEQLKQIAEGMQSMAARLENLEGKVNAKSDHGADGRKQRKQSVERADADGNDDT